jgi:DNA-directed RNA polymerase subunit RPC12/RpoP
VGLDGVFEDPFGGDPLPWSKKYFLKLCVECGAAFTGYIELDEHGVAIECPYYGAHDHAKELESEGLLTREPFIGMPTCTIWIPTPAGRILGARATD